MLKVVLPGTISFDAVRHLLLCATSSDDPAKELRLPTILREYDKVAQQCAVEQVDYLHYPLRITET